MVQNSNEMLMNQIKARVKTNLKKKAHTEKVVKIVFASLLIALGVLSLIFAVNVYYWYNWTSSKTYGADFYTDMQRTAADAANNISELGDMLETVGQQFFVMLGLILIVIGAYLCVKFSMQRIYIAKEIVDEIADEEYAKEMSKPVSQPVYNQYAPMQQMPYGQAPMNQPPMPPQMPYNQHPPMPPMNQAPVDPQQNNKNNL